MPGRTPFVTAALAVVLLVGTPGTGAAASTTVAVPPGSAETGPAAARRFVLDLAQPSDYVAQTNLVQCVGASVQMMLNIVHPGSDRTTRTQRQLQELARAMSGPAPFNIVRHGASVRGWVAALGIRGAGPYRLVGADSLEEAMHVAALAIRRYRQPVGLLVWRGRHAWVMSGFVSTADPGVTNHFRVTGAYIMDPLYPRRSTVWGPSPRPGRAIPVEAVGHQFVRRRSQGPWRASGPAWLVDKYVLVVPSGPIGWGLRTRQATLPT